MSIRSSWYSLGRLALVLFCLILVLALAILVLPIRFDLTSFRKPIGSVLSFFVEAPTTVDRIYLRPSLRPILTLEGVEVAGSGSIDAPRFSRAGVLEIRIALLPLARKRLQILQLRAADLDIHAQRRTHQPGNWPVWTENDWRITEISDLELDGITIYLDDQAFGRADLYLEGLRADISQTRPLDLRLRGTFENQPLSLTIAGPTLEAFAPRASDFPLSSTLDLSDLHLELEGTASRQPDGLRYRLQLSVGSPQFEFLQPFLESDPVASDGFDLTADLSNRKGWIDLRELEGRIGDTSLHGALSLGDRDSRPTLEGRLVVDRLDLSRLSTFVEEVKPRSDGVSDMSLLDRLDAALEIAIRQVDGTALEIENVEADLELSGGRLTAPVTFTALGIPVDATVTLDNGTGMPTLGLTGSVASVPLAALEPLIQIDRRLSGSIESVELEASARGRTPEELVGSLGAQLQLGTIDLQLRRESSRAPIELNLVDTRIIHQIDQPLTLSTRGQLLGLPFVFDANTVALNRLSDSSVWPVEAHLEATGVDLSVAAEISRIADSIALDLDFEAVGDRLGELKQWLGVPASTQLPFQLQGHLHSEGESRQLDLDDARIGRTRFSSTVSWIHDASDPPPSIVIDAATVDLQELASVFDPTTRLDSDTELLRIDLPLLPNQISLRDADIDMAVERLLRPTTDLTAAEFTLIFRDGKLQRSPFSFGYDDLATFTGQLELDLEPEIPHVGLSVSAHGEKLGRLLELEGLVERSPVSLTGLSLEIDARGSTIRQVLQSSDLAARFDDVHLSFPTEGTEPVPEVRFEYVTLDGPAAQPIVLEGDGRFEQQPVHMRMQLIPPPHTDPGSDASIPIELEADIASTRFALDGTFRLPLSDRHLAAQLHLSGANLSTLSALLGTGLPAIGPYRLDAGLAVREGVFEISDLDLEIAESQIQGTVDLDTRGERPRLAAHLTSPHLRTIDLLPAPEVTDSADDEGPSSPLSSFADLELALLDRFDADLDVAIETLEAHNRFFSDVTLEARLDKGALEIHAQQAAEDGNKAEIQARLEHAGDALAGDLSLHWSRQPYGAIVDLMGITGTEGSWSVSIDLSTRGSSAAELLTGLNGHVDFTDYPSGFKATVLDLWGGGFIESVLPVFGVGKESRLNCTVGRFQVESGVMTPETLLVDTTRSRVRGKGSIDLAADHMKLKLIPRPKQRNLINVATPVIISGSVTDPAIRVSTKGLAVTWFRLSLWVYTVWRDLLRKPLPTDGSDVCVDPPPRSEPALTATPVDRP